MTLLKTELYNALNPDIKENHYNALLQAADGFLKRKTTISALRKAIKLPKEGEAKKLSEKS